MPDEEWTLFIHDSASKGYSPKLYIGKVAKYIYTNQEPVYPTLMDVTRTL